MSCSAANCRDKRQHTPISPKLSTTVQKISQREAGEVEGMRFISKVERALIANEIASLAERSPSTERYPYNTERCNSDAWPGRDNHCLESAESTPAAARFPMPALPSESRRQSHTTTLRPDHSNAAR